MKKRSDDIKKLLQKAESGMVDDQFGLEIQQIISEENSEFQLLDKLKGRKDLLESAPENLFEITMKQIENKDVKKKQLPLRFDLYGKRIILVTVVTMAVLLSIFSSLNYGNNTLQNTTYIFEFKQIFNLPFELWTMTLLFASFIYLDRFLAKKNTFFV